jgi:cell shape-determining protein MreC
LKIIFIVSFFVLLSGLAFLFPKVMRGIFSTAAVPIWTVRDTIGNGFGNVTGFFSFKSSLISKVNDLQNQVTSLELKQTDYDAVEKENQDLKSLFGQNTASPDGRVLARVLSKPPESPYDTFVLDAGSDNGIAVGDKVYISDTILIGEIASLTGNTSIVNLFSKSGLTNFLTLSRTGATYDVAGEGGANMSVQVPKDADILWGDVFDYPDIKTSVVGSVYYIDQSAQSSFKTIFIRVPGNVFQTQWVFVDKGV